RTHLMDAMPVRLSQEISGWAAQVAQARERIEATLPRLAQLALGGTAVGTGINAHPEFGSRVAAALADITGLPFREADNHFAAQATQNTASEVSGQLKTYAAALMKIANDLRWMNSGPQGGLAEIALPPLQPGSSIMPGKADPVIPEASGQLKAVAAALMTVASDLRWLTRGPPGGLAEIALPWLQPGPSIMPGKVTSVIPEAGMMVCAQVMGNDITMTVAEQAGNF